MGINQYPSTGGSVIKSIQRGTAASAGNITITSVDTTKTMVRSFSTGAAGTVAARGTMGGTSTFPNNVVWNGTTGHLPTNLTTQTNYATGTGYVPPSRYGGYYYTYTYAYEAVTQNTRTITHSGTLSGGTTDLTAAEYGVYLSNSTTLVATGPCRYEVIEYT
jgi:hypothetical protein